MPALNNSRVCLGCQGRSVMFQRRGRQSCSLGTRTGRPLFCLSGQSPTAQLGQGQWPAVTKQPSRTGLTLIHGHPALDSTAFTSNTDKGIENPHQIIANTTTNLNTRTPGVRQHCHQERCERNNLERGVLRTCDQLVIMLHACGKKGSCHCSLRVCQLPLQSL